MTHDEAISNLKYLISEDCTDTKFDYIDEIELAIKALENQMPKKPINDWSESPFSDDKGCLFLHTMCPNCKKVEVNEMDSFCFNCGQAIDWGESE